MKIALSYLRERGREKEHQKADAVSSSLYKMLTCLSYPRIFHNCLGPTRVWVGDKRMSLQRLPLGATFKAPEPGGDYGHPARARQPQHPCQGL